MNLGSTFRKAGHLYAVLKADEGEAWLDRLGARIAAAILRAQEEAIEAALASGEVDPAKAETLDLLDTALGGQLGNRAIEAAGDLQEQAYRFGLEGILSTGGKAPGRVASYVFGETDRRAVAWLREDFGYWVGQAWGTDLSRNIRGALEPGFAAGESRRELATRLREALAPEIQKKGEYWKALADHITQRSRSFGVTEGLVAAGATHYRIRAVRDARTSEVCRSMHGRVFTVASAVAVRDALMGEQDPAKVKELAPWPKLSAVQGIPTGKLPPNLRLPPFHWRCRTTVELWRDEETPAGLDHDSWSAALALVNPDGFEPGQAKVAQVALARHFGGALRKVLDFTGPGGVRVDTAAAEGAGAWGYARARAVAGAGEEFPIYTAGKYAPSGTWTRGYTTGGAAEVVLRGGMFRAVNKEFTLEDPWAYSMPAALGDGPNAPNQLGTLYHELAHALRHASGRRGFEIVTRGQRWQFTGPTAQSRMDPRDYHPGEEFFAECFAAWLVSRKSLRRTCPDGADMVEEFLKAEGLEEEVRYLTGNRLRTIAKGRGFMEALVAALAKARVEPKRPAELQWWERVESLAAAYLGEDLATVTARDFRLFLAAELQLEEELGLKGLPWGQLVLGDVFGPKGPPDLLEWARTAEDGDLFPVVA